MQDFTVGRWRIQKPFQVVNLCFDEVHLSNNSELNTANQAYLKLLTGEVSSRAGDFVHDIFK
jgi:hypothetical protein